MIVTLPRNSVEALLDSRGDDFRRAAEDLLELNADGTGYSVESRDWNELIDLHSPNPEMIRRCMKRLGEESMRREEIDGISFASACMDAAGAKFTERGDLLIPAAIWRELQRRHPLIG